MVLPNFNKRGELILNHETYNPDNYKQKLEHLGNNKGASKVETLEEMKRYNYDKFMKYS